jgi:hypothetical protein
VSKSIPIASTGLTQWLKSFALYITVVALLASGNFSAFASENFVPLKLPRNVFIELPRNWVVISNNQRITLDSAVEAGLDLAGLEQENSILPFAANYYDDNGKTAGIVNIKKGTLPFFKQT